jgi:hypothetical protein
MTTQTSAERLASIAAVVRAEMERLGADQGMTLADYDAIARVVPVLPSECRSCQRKNTTDNRS